MKKLGMSKQTHVGVGGAEDSLTRRVEIRGFGTDERGTPYIHFRVRRGLRVKNFCAELDQIGPPLIRRLNQAGAHIVSETARRELIERVQGSNPTGNTFRVATRLGVHGRCFVLPGKIYSPSSKSGGTDLINSLDLNVEFYTLFRIAVSAKGWKKLVRIIRKNSRMMLALGVMLVGPLALAGEFEQIAFQLVGDPGIGKTAIGAAISTVWGYNVDPQLAAEYGFGDSWNHTANHLEELLSRANHTGLLLDETRLMFTNPGGWLETVMRIAAGKTKGRMNRGA